MSRKIVPSFEIPSSPNEDLEQPGRSLSSQLNETTTRSRRTSNAGATGESLIDGDNICNLKIPITELTFGVELELCFVVRRSLYFAWLGRPDPKTLLPTSPSQKRRRKDDDEGIFQMDDIEEVETRSDLSGSRFGSSTTGRSSIPSDNSDLQQSLRNYMVEFLNHTLPDSPKTPSVLGPVKATDSKSGTYEGWQVQNDASVTAHREEYANLHGKQLDDIKRDFHVGGVEIVSPILRFQDEHEWIPMLDQLYTDLNFDGSHGVWLNGSEGLHVHFAMQDEELELPTMQNVMALYGLFEREIEKWIDLKRRGVQWNHPSDRSDYCRSLRLGMERQGNEGRDIWAEDAKNKRPKVAHRYTPQEFTERIYAAKDRRNLKEQIRSNFDKNVTVYISEETRLKPTTLEFRHHNATTDPNVIKWWVKFCGYILKHARTLAALDVRLLDYENCATSFIEDYTKKSILDVIGFPEEGKEHFSRRAVAENDDGANAWRALEELIIQERIRRRKLGEVPDAKMDMLIKQEQWFCNARADLLIRHKLYMNPPDDEVQAAKDFKNTELEIKAEQISRKRRLARQMIEEEMHNG